MMSIRVRPSIIVVGAVVGIAALIVLSLVIVQAGEFKGSWSNTTGSWEGTITYTFEDSETRAWTEAERVVVRAAINSWTAKSGKVSWQEVTENADVPFTWALLDSDTAGRITLDADKPNGVIFNTDPTGGWYVDINPSDDEVILGGRWDLLSVAIHEVGHVLGLKHSFGQKASMDTWFSGVRQRITAVDEAALLRLYPEAESLVFSVGSLRDAVVGAAYPGHSFCDPEPAPGLFCGGPLPANPATRNPIGGTPNYTFSINGVGLPFGLTLNFNGVLTGTPKAGTPTGLQQFQVCATDQVGVKVCRQAEIYVIAPTPTPTPRPTATPVPPPPTPTPTPMPQPGSVAIQAADCTFASRIEYPNGVDEEFDVTITVTITGPVGTTFRVSRVHTATSQLWFSEYSSSWTGDFNTGRRDQGQPERNTWSESLRVHTFNEPGQQQSGTILFTATVTDSYGSKETSQTVTCPWQ